MQHMYVKKQFRGSKEVHKQIALKFPYIYDTGTQI